MRTAKLTMRPDTEVELSEAEYLDALRDGILVDPPKDDEAKPQPAAPAVAKAADNTEGKGK